MVRSCCVCKEEKKGVEDTRGFHKFPDDEDRKKQWLKALGRLSAAKTAVVCSHHSRQEDYSENPNNQRRILNSNAVPSVNLNVTSTRLKKQTGNLLAGASHVFHVEGSQSYSTARSLILQDCTNTDHSVESTSEQQKFSTLVHASSVQNDAPSENIENMELSPLHSHVHESPQSPNAHVTKNLIALRTALDKNENKRLREDSNCYDKPQTKKSNSDCVHAHGSNGSCDKCYLEKRSRDDAGTSLNENEPKQKKIKLTLGTKTIYYSESDFNTASKDKWPFLCEYIENERKVKKKLVKDNKALKELQLSMKEKQVLNKKGEEFMKTLPTGVRDLLSSILQGKRYKKYPDELRNFALNLHFYSPRAYLFIKENFGDLLPGISTLRNYLKDYNFEPGISMEAIESAKQLIAEVKKNKKHILFNLTCDEMAIAQTTDWDGSSKKMVGYVDYGNSKVSLDDKSRSTLASNAMVFMIVAINGHFKIPVACYFVKSLDGDDKKILLQEVLEACLINDIDIKNVTFDGIGSNVRMVENLGATLKRSTAEVSFEFTAGDKTKKIWVTLDACHALKLIRNTLDNHDIVNKNGEIISFRHIKALQKLQETEQLHAATKLRKRHVYFKNEIMKVNLAAQTLSSSVAKALDFCRMDLELDAFKDSAATSEFCQNVDDAFDILNSRNLYNKNPKKRAISRKNIKQTKKRVNELVDYFQSLSINNTPILQTKQHTGFLGMINGLRNVVAIAEELFATFSNFDFLLSYKFSQDHLETFFSCIRRLGGFNVNPSVKQVKAALRKLMAHASISVPLSANCVPLDDTILTVAREKKDGEEKIEKQEPVVIPRDELDAIFDLLDDIQLSKYSEDIAAYISGSVIKVIKKKISCSTCLNQLEMEKGEGSNAKLPVSQLQRRKCYGKLISASHDVIQICNTAERIFRLQISFAEDNLLDKLLLKTMHVLPKTILDDSNHTFEQEVLSDHRTQLIKLIIQQYHEVRLHYVAATEDEKKDRIRRRLTKLLTFKGV